MYRYMLLFWSYIRLQWYLITYGCWHGECEFIVRENNKIIYLAATKGSIRNNSIKPIRVFWEER